MCSPTCLALYSLSVVLFLLFAFALLTTQPFFVNGIEDVDLAKDNALGAALVFSVLFLASLGMMLWGGSGGGGDNGENYNYSRLNINLEYPPSNNDDDDRDYHLTSSVACS